MTPTQFMLFLFLFAVIFFYAGFYLSRYLKRALEFSVCSIFEAKFSGDVGQFSSLSHQSNIEEG